MESYRISYKDGSSEEVEADYFTEEKGYYTFFEEAEDNDSDPKVPLFLLQT